MTILFEIKDKRNMRQIKTCVKRGRGNPV